MLLFHVGVGASPCPQYSSAAWPGLPVQGACPHRAKRPALGGAPASALFPAGLPPPGYTAVILTPCPTGKQSPRGPPPSCPGLAGRREAAFPAAPVRSGPAQPTPTPPPRP
ncbi:hypothetical protein KIL84_006778, partial [Mauremys mutica]